MNNKNKLFHMLSAVAAVLLFTACSNDEEITNTPVEPAAVGTTIHYTATVNNGTNTRATLDENTKYIYQEGDKLEVTGTNISGTLTLSDGAGTANATFTGDLTYTGTEPIDDNLELEAVLVSTSYSLDDTEAPTYPKDAITSTFAEAVEKYSYFMGTSTYANKSFSMSQQTSFLSFNITFNDGTVAGTTFPVAITGTTNTGLITTHAEGSVTTKEVNGKVVAQFIVSKKVGTYLYWAFVKLGTSTTIRFVNRAPKTMAANKFYSVNRTVEGIVPTTLSALKATVNGSSYDDDYSNYIGCEVDEDGNVAKKVSPDKRIGYIAYFTTNSNVEKSLEGSRILVMSDKESPALKWSTSTALVSNITTSTNSSTTNMKGYEETQTLIKAITDAVDYPAAKYAWELNTFDESDTNKENPKPVVTGSTPWFLPTHTQMIKIKEEFRSPNIQTFADAYGLTLYRYYWGTSQASTKAAVLMVGRVQTNARTGEVKYLETITNLNDDKTNSNYVRAVFAY